MLTSSNPKQKNVSSLEDEAEGFKKSFLSKVFRLTTEEGQNPSPELIGVLRSRGALR
jgi:hypothetical protein